MAKIRISLFSPDKAIPISDRLVDHLVEFANGPKEKHDGPIGIQTVLESKDQVEGLITYLSQLSLDMPLSDKAKKVYERKSQSTSILEEEPLMELIKTALLKSTHQEDLMDFLRNYNFVFLSQDHIDEMSKYQGKEFPWKLRTKKDPETQKKKVYHTNYQFMVRQLKLAKDPKNDKYDTQLAFGFKLFGDKYPKVVIYLYGKYYKTLELHWKDAKEINFKVKEKFYKFPEAMTYAERAKWRAEDRKLLSNPEMEPSKFYLRWKEYVTILKPLELK